MKKQPASKRKSKKPVTPAPVKKAVEKGKADEFVKAFNASYTFVHVPPEERKVNTARLRELYTFLQATVKSSSTDSIGICGAHQYALKTAIERIEAQDKLK